ncbi:PIN domain-containing protein [Candidatus Microgenomates bacterium]|nr:PIN domain-containing protein [Candidatus Microgenomates bacterium]
MTKIFVDSNYFIALYNPEDSLYENAQRTSRVVTKEKPQLVISNFIFLETVTVLSQRAGKDAAILIGKHLIRDQRIEIIYINEELNELTWKIFQQIKRKNLSFVDASIIACMQYEDINKLLTFDEEDFSNLRRKYRFSFF